MYCSLKKITKQNFNGPNGDKFSGDGRKIKEVPPRDAK
jgi:hypothetical protein